MLPGRGGLPSTSTDVDLGRFLLRLALWHRRPPSGHWLLVAVVTLAVCVQVVAIEWAGWWPESWRSDRVRMLPRP